MRMARLLLLAALLVTAACTSSTRGQGRGQGVTVFEGARLITGDGSAPIENSSFIVQNGQFARVGLNYGVAQCPASGRTIDELLQAASQATRQDKVASRTAPFPSGLLPPLSQQAATDAVALSQ